MPAAAAPKSQKAGQELGPQSGPISCFRNAVPYRVGPLSGSRFRVQILAPLSGPKSGQMRARVNASAPFLGW